MNNLNLYFKNNFIISLKFIKFINKNYPFFEILFDLLIIIFPLSETNKHY